MGFIVAANPFGQMLFSPLVGWWSNRLGSIRIPLIFSLLLFTFASAIYSCLELFDGNIKHWMLWSRFLVGVSSGKRKKLLKKLLNEKAENIIHYFETLSF